MSPLEHYHEQLENGHLLPDEAQAKVVQSFQRLHDQLRAPRPAPPRNGLLARLRRQPPPPLTPITGLYLWGGVGRGKTWLMDLFFHSLPIAEKRRTHFHRFMGEIHRELKHLKGQSEPLQLVAEKIARDTRVLCLDEFQVWDIGDAMILGGLLSALFDQGITLVATSNTQPDGLYPNGLQRSRFVPAIERIKEHSKVVELDSDTDYRLRYLEQAETYHSPLDETADGILSETFQSISPEPGEIGGEILINERPIGVRRVADSILWLNFDALCDGPRSQADYLELSRCYHTLLISDIPRMNDGQNDQAKRFINLIDVLYDHNVTLIVSAEEPPESLYRGAGLAFEFQRTVSRLREMQSHEWLERVHLG